MLRTHRRQRGARRGCARLARFGDCESVAYVRQGACVVAEVAWTGCDLMASAGRIAALIQEWRPSLVKIDAIGVMFSMRSLLQVYEATQAPEFLDAAVKAARVLSSWVYLWDVPFPGDSLLGRSGFRSTGWAGCDVIPAGSYLDNEFAEPGTPVNLIWGEPDGGTDKPIVERHRQVEFRATVSPVPYSEVARKSYADGTGWRAARKNA